MPSRFPPYEKIPFPADPQNPRLDRKDPTKLHWSEHILLDREVFEELQRASEEARLQWPSRYSSTRSPISFSRDRNGYPWLVFHGPLAKEQRERRRLLHLFVWDRAADLGRVRPRRIDERGKHLDHVHHVGGDPGGNKRPNKLDSRLVRLRLVTHQQHAKIEAALRKSRRQVFSPHLRDDLSGFYVPHAPGPERRPSSPEGPAPQTKGAEESSTSPAKRLEQILARQLKDLLDEVDPAFAVQAASRGVLDIYAARPTPGEYRTPDVFRLGLKAPNLTCSPGECALVRLLFKYGFDRRIVAQHLGVELELVGQMLRVTRVHHAVQQAQRRRSLPVPRERSGRRA